MRSLQKDLHTLTANLLLRFALLSPSSIASLSYCLFPFAVEDGLERPGSLRVPFEHGNS